MARDLWLDPNPAAKLESLEATDPGVAAVIEECLDWIEVEPVDPRATRRRFTNGMWAIVRAAGGADWLILWDEEEKDHPVVRYIGETTSL